MYHFVSYLTQTCETVCAVPDKLLETAKFKRGGVGMRHICPILIDGFLIEGGCWCPLIELMKRNNRTIAWVIYI